MPHSNPAAYHFEPLPPCVPGSGNGDQDSLASGEPVERRATILGGDGNPVRDASVRARNVDGEGERRLKILISAYACIPGEGSEPGIGWEIPSRLSTHHEVHVITMGRHRSKIEQAVTSDMNLIFHYLWEGIPLPNTLGWLLYYLWQWRASALALELHREHVFAICHSLTFGTWRVPSFLFRLAIPMVWGPVGGGQVTPAGFGTVLGVLGRIDDGWRNLCQWMSRHDPLVRLAMRKASVILCSNRDTFELIPEQYRSKADLAPSFGVTVNPATKKTPSPEPLEILWVGRILPWKGLALLLRAMTRIRNRAVHLTVLGAGMDQRRCHSIARRMKLNVSFAGWVPRTIALSHYRSADAFVFTSLHDSYAIAVMEAMAAGVPAILLDCGGAREIPDDCAVKISTDSPAEAETKLAAAIERLANNPAELAVFGEAGRAFAAQHYTWDTRINYLLSIYIKLVPISVTRLPVGTEQRLTHQRPRRTSYSP